MCEPSMIMMAVSTAVSVTSTAISAASQSAQADAQADAQRAAAADAQQRAAAEAGRIRTAASQAIGTATTALGASGVDSQVGSPLSAVAGIRQESELDVETAKANGVRAARGHMAQADIYESAGDNAVLQGGLAAGASFLEGAAAGYARGAKADWWSKGKSTVAGLPTTTRNPISYG